MKQIDTYIFEKFKISKDINPSSKFDKLIEYLERVFYNWKYKYDIKKMTFKDGSEFLKVTFNCKISDKSAAQSCSNLNADLKWSKYDNYIARWSNSPMERKFIISIYENSE